MEFFVCIGILIFIKLVEWSLQLFIFSLMLMWNLLILPFKLIKKSEPAKRNISYKNGFSDPIEKAYDHWDNSPKDLDMEDMFWLDEILGDD